MSSLVEAYETDRAAWIERTAALAALLESLKRSLDACGRARAAKKRAQEAEQRAGGPSGGRISPIWPSVAWWQQAGKKQQQTPGLSPVTQYFPLDISLLAKDSILEQFGAPFGEPFAEPGHGINEARQAEGLPAVSETGAGNQSFAPDGGGGAGGGNASSPPSSPQDLRGAFGSGAPDFGSGQPSFGSGAPSFGSGAPDFGPGAPSFNKPQSLGSGAPDFGSGAPSFNKPPSLGSGAPDFGSGAPSFGPGAPDFGKNSAPIGSDPGSGG